MTRVTAITWGIAGALAAISAVLAAPSQVGTSPAALGPYLLMVTLGAAAFGAFVSLPLALGGGLLLGVVSQLVNAQTSSGPDAELAVFVLILLVVLARGKAIAKVFALAGSVVDDLPPLRVPASLRRSSLVLHNRKAIALGTLFLLCIWPQLPYFHSSSHQFDLGQIMVYAIIGVALTMLVGWGGQVSLGHFALVGIGAYLTARWSSHGLSLPALAIIIGLIGAVVMVIVGLPALRVRGLTLGVTTLGFAVIVSDWLFQQTWFATSQPTDVMVQPPRIAARLGTPSSQEAVYYTALVALVLACAVAAALRRSNPGRLILAVRDNERSSAALGVSPATVKLSVLAISGFFAAAAGVFWADVYQSAYPAQFTPDVSLAVVAIPVIGGLGSIGGAVLAAVLIYGATFFAGSAVAPVFGGSAGNDLAFSLFIVGVGQILVLQYLPNGLAGVIQGWWERYLARRARYAETTRSAAPRDVPLVVSNTHVHFGGVVALDIADLEVRAGEIVGLIGTNGAGKTTLMNVVSGLIEPSRGSVSLFGNEVIDLPPDFRLAYGLARSFQDASLFAGLSVTETVQVALAHRHKVGVLSAMLAAPWVRANERATRREAQAIVERFGLSEWGDTRTSDLSTGTRRICDLAVQVAARPKLLLLDEPTSGVAQREAEAFVPLLQRIRDELDCAILIVEHDMSLLMRLCNRIYAMEAGSVIAEGTPDEVRHDPRVVASYLGTSEAAISRSDLARPRQPAKRAARPATKRATAASNGGRAASARTTSNGEAKKRAPAGRTT